MELHSDRHVRPQLHGCSLGVLGSDRQSFEYRELRVELAQSVLKESGMPTQGELLKAATVGPYPVALGELGLTFDVVKSVELGPLDGEGRSTGQGKVLASINWPAQPDVGPEPAAPMGDSAPVCAHSSQCAWRDTLANADKKDGLQKLEW